MVYVDDTCGQLVGEPPESLNLQQAGSSWA